MFAKVFTQIFDSSIAEDYQVRLVFEDFLTLADIDGVVDMTRKALSRRTNVPIEIVNRAIDVLEKPDPESHRPDEEGRRIKRLDDHRDWGWFIVNYEYYRSLASEEQRRTKTRERVRRFREKPNNSESCNADVTKCNDSPSTSSYTSSSSEGESVRGGIDWSWVVPHWNSLAKKHGLSGISKMTDKRKAKYKARTNAGSKEGEAEFWKVVERELPMIDDWCLGQSERGWTMTFDFIVRSEDNFTKLQEGNYRKKTRTPNRVKDDRPRLDRPSPKDKK